VSGPGGGTQPRWRHDSQELFYVAPNNQLMTVRITVLLNWPTLVKK
jgi:hypothetical protein